MKKILSFLALAGSMGTMVCCFLPAVFVTLGFGAAFAGMVSNFPQLIWISEHKKAVFLGAALLIIASAVLHWRSKQTECPIDPKLAAACKDGKDWSRWVLVGAVGLFATGAFFAFVLPKLVN